MDKKYVKKVNYDERERKKERDSYSFWNLKSDSLFFSPVFHPLQKLVVADRIFGYLSF
jgi:hypothetical protein